MFSAFKNINSDNLSIKELYRWLTHNLTQVSDDIFVEVLINMIYQPNSRIDIDTRIIDAQTQYRYKSYGIDTIVTTARDIDSNILLMFDKLHKNCKDIYTLIT